MAGVRVRLLAAASGLCMAFIGAQPAQAAATEDLCATRSPASSYPAAELVSAADRAEALIGRARSDSAQLDAALAALAVPAGSGPAPDAAALARYCAAAGEVMRLSVLGSQAQAQTYLMSAYRHARDAGSGALTSRAAYRLGLVSLAGPAAGSVRGGPRGRRGGSSLIVEEAQQAQTTETEACAALAQANLAAVTNTYVSALALECAADRARAAGDFELAALAHLRLARLGLAWSQAPAANAEELRRHALDTAAAGIPIAGQVADPPLRAELIGRLIGTAIDLGGASHPVIAPGLNAMRTASNASARALTASIEARLALAAGNLARARALIEQAILHESQKGLPIRLPDHYLLLAEADPERRERHVFAAYTTLDNLRPLLPRTDPLTEESIFALHMRRVFESAVEVKLASADIGDEAPRIREAQEIVEAYRQAELQSAVGSECLPPREAVRPQDLAAGEILLYPLLLPDRVELLYTRGGDSGYRRLPPNRDVNRQEVARLVEELVLSMSYGEDENWRAASRRLYDILIRPIEGELGPQTVLAVIPDGPLRSLPFASLVAPDGDYLVRKTRLSVAPALAYSQPGGPDEDRAMSVVAASLQRQMMLPAGFFEELKGTASEAQIAAQNGSPGRHIADFRKADLEAAMAGAEVDVLHLATHASFNGRSDRAFIVANGEVIRMSELRDIIAGSRTRGEALDLLVLSACETAVGDDEASMGLAGAAVQAGALSAIASLWQVDDAGTAELMRQFYSRYREGRSRSEALREAQLALIEGGGSNARPTVWAAFTLLGAWR